ncbi:MAG: class I tRNA ligase family protein [Candidatus Sungbacteria bacterium]|nr:class I tRNA ligase family protein [Candidatus Sungbacteria bacterium]
MPTEKGETSKKLKRIADAARAIEESFGAAKHQEQKPEAVRREEDILEFWKKNQIFEKSLELRRSGKTFVFYEGPPTANGNPGIHHFEARTFKDVIPRFKSMQGYHVPRRAGWDTHGLPVEIQVEKTLGFKTKQDIENYGIAAFNEKCRESVWKYIQGWERFTDRIAFWLDTGHPYITYERSYMETLWWIIAEWWNKRLLYQDFKVLPWCTRCGTGLSSHEIALGYKSVVDASVYVRFRITGTDPKWQNVALLAWTTTPWTLPGNLALAVSESMQYVRVPDPEKKGYWVVVGRDNFPILVKRGVFPKDAKASVPFPGKELLGLSYQPLFDVPELQTSTSYKVYAADFVKADEGAGIVHTAVMYGDDDYRLGKRVGLPTTHTVTDQGKFVSSLKGFAGRYVKSKDTELALLTHLQRQGALFREEAYEHEYPHCWRCDTPILYYARSSWWVRVNSVRKQLLKNNEAINWVPAHLKRGRFGEWLREGKDWAFSRERYWGTTLPLWRCNACGQITPISSVEELAGRAMHSGNRYIIMRHGESQNITEHIVDSWPEPRACHLTEAGQRQVSMAAETLKGEHVDVIFASDLVRTKETAELISAALGGKEVVFDERLREIGVGEFNGGSNALYHEFFKTPLEKLEKAPLGGESLLDVRARVAGFFKDVEKKYRGKTVLVVTHTDPGWMLLATMQGLSREAMLAEWVAPHGEYLEPAGYRIVEPRRFPLNHRGEVDLHRPYVDEVTIRCSCGGVKSRVPEVADVWFDSGAMPFGQLHYPFEEKDSIDRGHFFPADYICEAVDQTRGWFYTLLAVSTLLGKGAPYKNVISLGHVLDRHGQKMSKSRGNVVDPWQMIEKYGVDAIRWYFYTVNAPEDPKKFDEKDLVLKLRGFLGTLWNSYLLFETYAGEVKPIAKPSSLLDRWVLSRLMSLVSQVTQSLEAYDVVSAARLIESFTVDDFSNWYLRRSRRRFQRPETKRDFQSVTATTAEVLLTLSALTAAFCPYLAESLYAGLKPHLKLKEESVHLRDWPKSDRPRAALKLEKKMMLARTLAAEGLRQRAEAKIKVRQPLSELKVKSQELRRYPELLELVREEVNVKKISVDAKQKPASVLITAITDELRNEGIVREVVRNIQELRRELGLSPRDRVRLQLESDVKLGAILRTWSRFVATEVGASAVQFGHRKKFRVQRDIPVEGGRITVAIV